MKPLPIINKSKHPKKGRKYKEQKGRKEGPTTSKKTIEPSKKANYKGRNIKFSNPPPPLAISISNKERGDPFEMGGPFESTSSLKKILTYCNSMSQNRDRLHMLQCH